MRIIEIPKNIGMFLIRVYQKTLSFDHSFWADPLKFRVCIHYPSCSQYTYLSIQKFGLIKGSIMGFFRILRCNPLNQNRLDEVPKQFTWGRVIMGSKPKKV
ncbi:membrane protein insertion efficiency factor YidD [Candidatus Dojkabacteria bacterium]|nr:membrane protein insertion efficiency factor YidD [Candidatus Dojkabacteria bacterium]